MHEEDYRPIDDFLRRFVNRSRRVRGLESLCLAGTALAVLAALGVGVDAVKELLPYAPLAFSLLSVATLLVVAGLTLLHFLRSRSLSWAARTVERQRPELRNNLINSLQLYPQLADSARTGGASAPMIHALIRQTRDQIRPLQPAALVDVRPLRAKARLLALAAAPAVVIPWLLVAAHAASRASAVLAIATGRYVRETGAAKPVADGVAPSGLALALATGAAAVAALWHLASPAAMLAGLTGLAIGHVVMRGLYERKLGGYTGDCLGAVQQTSELGLYLGVVAVL